MGGTELEELPGSFLKDCMKLPGGELEAVACSAPPSGEPGSHLPPSRRELSTVLGKVSFFVISQLPPIIIESACVPALPEFLSDRGNCS